MKNMIPVSKPALAGNEMKYVRDCLESTWISSVGGYIEQFESAFAGFCGTEHAITCCNGTAALHLALAALEVGPGDEVLVPALTYVATANAVRYCGATPVFVDSEWDTWNMDTRLVEPLITTRTKGIIAVHLFGHPADMNALNALALEKGLFVIEDAAEAHGAEYNGKRTGALADVGTFSFYGNKIISTGEGGMLTTDNEQLAKRIRLLKGQGMDPKRRYWFPVLGYNYRMTNIAAAIGLAQMEAIEWHMEQRRRVAHEYYRHLAGLDGYLLQVEQPWAKHAYWLPSVVLPETCPRSRDEVMSKMLEAGIETRPFFVPMHKLPMYAESTQRRSYPIAEELASRGINLPSYAELKNEEILRICDALIESVT